MKRSNLLFSLTFLFSISECKELLAGDRKSSNNTIAWFNTFHTINVNKKVSLPLEYQWRRTEGLKNWQQSLFRTMVQYSLSSDLKVAAGYAWAETFPYGDYPPAVNKPFPEHRIFQQITWDDKKGRILLNHRGRLEQRFLGILDPLSKNQRQVANWSYMNRIRYQLKVTVPVNKKTITDKTFYASIYDEIFIGFGKNVAVNVFDQNRVGVIGGYRFNGNITLEAGWLNQTLQQMKLVDNKPVFQYNHGIIFNLLANWN